MKRFGLTLLAVLAASACVVADEPPAVDSATQAQMEELGPPKEMQQLAWLVGDWDAMNKERFDPTVDKWDQSHSLCSFNYALAGAVLEMHTNGSYRDFPYQGLGLFCWDRIHQEWQMAWTDNASGVLTIYTGQTKDGVTQLVSKSDYMGKPYWTRVTMSTATTDSFDWTYEESVDEGQTWNTFVTAKYTKKK